jgi:hypothetical protein
MTPPRPHWRIALAASACFATAGCSFFRHDSPPTAPPPARAAAAPIASTPPPMAAGTAASAPPLWGQTPLRHLDPATLVGQTWIFPSAAPQFYRDQRFVFSADRVEASNAREHATGTWTVERDRLCVTLKPGAEGTACYVVTGTMPGQLQIRVLPDGERLPLKIQ